MGIEGVHFHVINTPTKMKRLVDDLNSPNVRVIFDPVNYINTANYKNQDEIINTHFDLLGEKTKLLHLKDFKLVTVKLLMNSRATDCLIKICFGIS